MNGRNREVRQAPTRLWVSCNFEAHHARRAFFLLVSMELLWGVRKG
jgi:hypothetical protein